MPNLEKRRLMAKQEKVLGPVPKKPEWVEKKLWAIATHSARRQLVAAGPGADLKEIGRQVTIPEAAQVRINKQRWIGRKFLTWREFNNVRSILVYRTMHDRSTENGQRGFDTEVDFG